MPTGPQPSEPRLSVVVPTNERWAHVATVVQPVLAEAAALDVQVVVCGAGSDTPPEFGPQVTVVHHPGGDLFTARAKGIAAATGDVVAVLEDHIAVPSGWLTQLVQAWRDHPDATALLFDVHCDPSASVLEQALFTITFGPFIQATEPPRHRAPVPGMVSLRRDLLPPAPEPGQFEYGVLAQVATSPDTRLTHVPAPVHAQHVRLRALALNYHSGRSYGSGYATRHPAGLAASIRRIARELRTVGADSRAARRRQHPDRSPGIAFTAATVALLAAHGLGQLVGVATGSPGRSHRRLE